MDDEDKRGNATCSQLPLPSTTSTTTCYLSTPGGLLTGASGYNRGLLFNRVPLLVPGM